MIEEIFCQAVALLAEGSLLMGCSDPKLTNDCDVDFAHGLARAKWFDNVNVLIDFINSKAEQNGFSQGSSDLPEVDGHETHYEL